MDSSVFVQRGYKYRQGGEFRFCFLSLCQFKSPIKCVLQLLEKDASIRLGSALSPLGDIVDHRFFHNINWAKLEQRELDPPFKPAVVSVFDILLLKIFNYISIFFPFYSDIHWTHNTLIRRSPKNAWDWHRSWRRSWNRWTRNSLQDSHIQIRMQRWLEGDRVRVKINRRRGLETTGRKQQQDEGEKFNFIQVEQDARTWIWNNSCNIHLIYYYLQCTSSWLVLLNGKKILLIEHQIKTKSNLI